jgi:hypothetical protein
MHVRRTTENGVYVYHVAEAHPQGQVDKVALWRTDRGYFGEITLREDADSIVFDEYPEWGKLKRDLITCLHEELQCPEFDEYSELRPPLLRRLPDAR